jgi:hypothetical protein
MVFKEIGGLWRRWEENEDERKEEEKKNISPFFKGGRRRP